MGNKYRTNERARKMEMWRNIMETSGKNNNEIVCNRQAEEEAAAENIVLVNIYSLNYIFN